MKLTAINPCTGLVVAERNALTQSEIDAALARAETAFGKWRIKGFDDKADVLCKIASALRTRKEALAVVMAEEMGKPIQQGRLEVEKAAGCAEYYAANAAAFLASETIPSDATNSFVCYQPMGIILGILPWNMPVWLAFRFCVPALMAGNTCLLKHDPHVPKTAALLDEIFTEAAPIDIAINLAIVTSDIGSVIKDRRVAAVSFTGSSAAGRKVAALAGECLKPSVLELGGSDPCIIMADANIEQAATAAVASRINNNGQSCIAAKRILVEKSIYPQFSALVRTKLANLTQGNPLDENTQLGPLARSDLRATLHQQVTDSITAGARCVLGGTIPAMDGYFYPATLLTDVTPAMRVFSEETFGPVACLTPFDNIEQALALANLTEYGLGAAVWTNSNETADFFATYIVSGQIAINGIVKTDPRLPSGGVKNSGFGRELGPHGIREFVNTKQVWKK